MRTVFLRLLNRIVAADGTPKAAVSSRMRVLNGPAVGMLLWGVMTAGVSGRPIEAGAPPPRFGAEAEAAARKIFKKSRLVYEESPGDDILRAHAPPDVSSLTENPPPARMRALDVDGRTRGYVYVDTVQGKWGPIRYLVALDAQGAVKDVVILATHEIRGKAVGKKRFRRQYKGKTCRDPLRLNRDIQGISGATQSSRALTQGVKKIVCFHEAWRQTAGP